MNIDMKQLRNILTYINKYRLILVWLLILALFGFSLLRAQDISNPHADMDYLGEQREEIESTALDIDEDLRVQIEELLETPVDTDPDNLGTEDPFNP